MAPTKRDCEATCLLFALLGLGVVALARSAYVINLALSDLADGDFSVIPYAAGLTAVSVGSLASAVIYSLDIEM